MLHNNNHDITIQLLIYTVIAWWYNNNNNFCVRECLYKRVSRSVIVWRKGCAYCSSTQHTRTHTHTHTLYLTYD